MISYFGLTLRGWFSNGRPLTRSAFLDGLAVPSGRYRCVGRETPGDKAYLFLADLSADSFKSQRDPVAAFDRAVVDALVRAADVLALIDRNSIAAMMSDGLTLDLFVDVRMDQNQLDLEFPGLFIAQAARLGVPIKVEANSA